MTSIECFSTGIACPHPLGKTERLDRVGEGEMVLFSSLWRVAPSWRMFWIYFMMILFPLLVPEPPGIFFLDIHQERLIGFPKVRLIKVWGPLRLQPSRISQSPSRPHTASNNSPILPPYSYRCSSFSSSPAGLSLISLHPFICPGFGGLFTLSPQFFDGSRKLIDF